MMQSSETPTDGEFARYIEQLTQRNTLIVASHTLSSKFADVAPHRSPRMLKPNHGPSTNTPAEALRSTRFLNHLKWLAAASFGVHLLASKVPGTAYAAWTTALANRESLGELKKKFRQTLNLGSATAQRLENPASHQSHGIAFLKPKPVRLTEKLK